ncbi:MAG: SCO family protein [Acidobacteriota bacterium]
MSRVHPTRWLYLALALSALSVAAACQQSLEPAAERYALSGKVVAVDPEAALVTLEHEAVPGFMGPMTMPFHLKDEWALEELKRGDRVEATLVVAVDGSWLEGIVISRRSGEPDTVSELPDPEPGAPVPNFTLVNQEGEPIDLARYRGRALVLTFIYSRCPLPEFCPRMTRHFGVLEQSLREEPALYEKTHLLSISFDPEHDTPEALKEYARRQVNANEMTFRHWEFATGTPDQVRQIADFFALTYWPEEDQILHTLRTAVIAPDGTLHKLYHGNAWKPEEILEDLKSLKYD